MLRNQVLIGVLLEALAIAPLRLLSAQNDHQRVNGRGFSIPIPPGFAPVNDNDFAREIWKGGGVLVAQEHPPNFENPEVASVFVTITPGSSLADPDSCAAFARSQTRLATLLTSGLVPLAGRQVCRYTAMRNTNVPGVISNQIVVVLGAGTNRLTFICTYDPRDTAAIQSCEYALSELHVSQDPQ